MNYSRQSKHLVPSRMVRGLSLIELMIAMVLGLLVVGAAGGVFLANKRVYAATETLNRVQENSRVSFELMSRDVREAGGSPCGKDSQFVNMLQVPAGTFWETFGDGLRGTDGGSVAGTGSAPVANAVAGTDALDIYTGSGGGAGDYVITDQDTPSAVVGIKSASDPTLAGLADGDIAIACNTSYTLIFQITSINGSSLKAGHHGGSGSPGNCGQDFQFVAPTNCSGASGGNTYCFTKPNSATSAACDKSDDMPAILTKLGGFRWYVGDNGRGGRSLYKANFNMNVLTAVPTVGTREEIAEGVSDLQLMYRSTGSATFIGAAAVTNWKQVNAVRIRVVAEGADGALSGAYVRGTDNQRLSRDFTHVVAIRNREGVL